jgi:hypothetical protein
MGQVTIYLDDESESRLRASAKAKGVPVSRWIAELVREKTKTEWPDDVKSLAGAWSDLPETEALRAAQGEDVEREAF